jgi:uncharacterized protein YjiS (DUF1127 family)
VQSMSMHESRYRSAAALLLVATAMRAGARQLFAAARRLQAWLDRRRAAEAAFHDFGTMGERELLDIGLTRVDVHRVAWGASDRNHDQSEVEFNG